MTQTPVDFNNYNDDNHIIVTPRPFTDNREWKSVTTPIIDGVYLLRIMYDEEDSPNDLYKVTYEILTNVSKHPDFENVFNFEDIQEYITPTDSDPEPIWELEWDNLADKHQKCYHVSYIGQREDHPEFFL